MSYNQLKQPNLTVVGQEGLCLAYVTEVFGIPNKYPSATVAWQDAQYPHPNETPPINISVPVWFKYDGPDGHVAVWSNGVIHSTSAQGMKTFNSIQELCTWMGEGMTYLGWSEDINSIQVVESEEEMFNEGDRLNLNKYLYGKDNGYFKDKIGMDWKTAMYQLFSSGSQFDQDYKTNSGDIANIDKTLGTTDAPQGWNWKDIYYSYIIGQNHLPNPGSATKLGPGLYRV